MAEVLDELLEAFAVGVRNDGVLQDPDMSDLDMAQLLEVEVGVDFLASDVTGALMLGGLVARRLVDRPASGILPGPGAAITADLIAAVRSGVRPPWAAELRWREVEPTEPRPPEERDRMAAIAAAKEPEVLERLGAIGSDATAVEAAVRAGSSRQLRAAFGFGLCLYLRLFQSTLLDELWAGRRLGDPG